MKLLLAIMISLFTVGAEEITLTDQQMANWQIKTAKVTKSQMLSLGDFMMEVKTPPTLLQAITLGFEARVNKLYIAQYQAVMVGDPLIEVSGAAWIEAQKALVSHAMAYRESSLVANRKNNLCKEGIIPQKECITANAARQHDRVKLAASKAALEAYGVTKTEIETLIKTFKMKESFLLRAKNAGIIIEQDANIGENINAGMPIMVIQEVGDLWLEVDLPLTIVKQLQTGAAVNIMIDDQTITSEVLQLSPVINSQNQTRHARFSLSKEAGLLTGYRGIGTLRVARSSLLVPKEAVIKGDKGYVVFVKKKKGFKPVSVEIVAEGDGQYNLTENPALDADIAVSSLAVLKSMMGE